MKIFPRQSGHGFGERGLTLVELLVAMTISMVILAGIYQVFVLSAASYRKNEAYARMQENARFVMEFLGRDLRMAGYTGCAVNTGEIVNTLNDTGFLFNFNVGVQGFEYTGPTTPTGVDALDYTPNLDSSVPLTDLVEGSDILTVRRVGGGDPIYLEVAMPDVSADLKVTDGTSTDLIDTNDIVMVSDCVSSAIFQVTNYTQSSGNVVHNAGGTPIFGDPDYPGNATKNLGNSFGPGSEIIKLSTVTYLIRNSSTGVPSLYLSDYNSSAELVQGVERMKVRYGVDNDGDRQVDAYTTASGVADWNDVVAIRVVLLLQSAIDLKAPLDTATYDLDGDGVNEYDPPDERRMRKVFKATFALRNRVS